MLYIFGQFSIRPINNRSMKPMVIEILSDSEQKDEINKQQVRLVQKMMKDQACLLSDPLNLMMAVQKQFIQANEADKDLILAQRINKMFLLKYQFDIEHDHYCMRRDPQYNVEGCSLVLSELIIYGTDLWPVKSIKREGQQLSINLEVFKIDESHVKIKFADFDTAKKWLDFHLIQKGIFDIKMQEESQNIEEPTEANPKLKGWFQLTPYQYQSISRKLWARFSTSLQSDIGQLIQQTVTTAFVKFKQDIATFLLQSDQAKEAFLEAEQRSRQFAKHRRSQAHRPNKNDSYSSRNSQREPLRRDRYTRHGTTDKYERSRNKRHDESREHYHQQHKRGNQTIFNNTVAHTHNGDDMHNATTMTGIANQIIPMELTQRAGSNLEDLLDIVSESNNHDISITKQFDKMKLEEGELQQALQPSDDMSIDLVSVQEMKKIREKKAELDTSNIIDRSVANLELGADTRRPQLKMRRHDKNQQHERRSTNEQGFSYAKYLEYMNQKDAEHMNRFINK